jgi:uncharacterized membrane protein YwzB
VIKKSSVLQVLFNVVILTIMLGRHVENFLCV